ncbi:MAG: helix-turn-helix domain-containing protein [Candidatus Binataceae bacterium]
MSKLEDKLPEAISSADLDALIGREENQRLEFKETIDGTNNHELAKDLASLSNGGGGYLIVGAIEDVTTKRCSGFRSIAQPEPVRSRLKSVALQYIKERLPLSPEVRQTSAGVRVVLLPIPQSTKLRAVEFDGRTEYWKRFGSDKRQMSHVEVMTALGSPDNLEKEQERERLLLANRSRWNEIKSPQVLWEAMDQQFHDHPWVSTRQRKWLRLTITPEELREDRVNTSDVQLHELVMNPERRHSARHWNIDLGDGAEVNASSLGLECRVTKPKIIPRLIIISRSGHVEFWTQFQETSELLRCDFQDDRGRRSYLVLEPAALPTYTIGFLRFAKELYHHLHTNCDFTFRTEFGNLEGVALAAGAWKPGLGGECFKIFAQPHFGPVETTLGEDINPEEDAFATIVKFYRAFGYERQHIPFFPNGKFAPGTNG